MIKDRINWISAAFVYCVASCLNSVTTSLLCDVAFNDNMKEWKDNKKT